MGDRYNADAAAQAYREAFPPPSRSAIFYSSLLMILPFTGAAWYVFADEGNNQTPAEIAASQPDSVYALDPASWEPGATPETTSITPIESAAPPNAISISWLPETITAWKTELENAGAVHGVDPNLLAIIMLVESGGHEGARSCSGATGLMQVMPTTAADIVRQRGLTFDPSKLAIPATNIDFGAWYLAQQLRAFGTPDDPDWQSSVELAAAAYNGGPGSVQRLLAGGALSAETARYRQWVGGMWRERHEASSDTFKAWLNAGGQILVNQTVACN